MSLDWLDDELANVAAAGLLRRRRVVRPLPHGRCEVDGRTLINFATNDYLDLASHPRVVEMAQQALAELGAGGRGSALIVGRTPWHDSLENRLARFEGTAAAILFPSGYAANVGTITALVGPDDAVFCDRLNHASLIDGCRLSRAKFHVYPHRDVSALDNILSKRSATASTATGARLPRRLIVTDSLFSMDGDIAPLRELVEVADRHEAMLLIDEAHATGVFGHHGRGLAEVADIEGHPRVIRVGTLSKAIGSQGGFVAGSQSLIDWLFNHARPQMFSTSLSPAACGAAIAALDVIAEEPERRTHLHQLGEALRTALRERKIPFLPDSNGPILPIIIGGANQTMELSKSLEQQGFLVPAIRPPTVPRNSSRLRISLSTALSIADITSLVENIAV